MRTVDFSPLYRSSIGFDRLFNILDTATQDASTQSYPPYDIESTGENTFRISIAVAGFSDDELNIEVKDRALLVSGQKADKSKERHYMHHGIAARDFERRFQLAEHVVVKGADLKHGLLNIDLRLEVPEALKPRTIQISRDQDKSKVLEDKVA